ncbi:MAG TPA: hypothetical protein VNH22_13800 [Blastocatellia bacterium]|jgi:hypothetical protein|nr:hypothetical protein [Blastocatellia bacterium]
MRNKVIALTIGIIGLSVLLVNVQCQVQSKMDHSSALQSQQGTTQSQSRRVNGQVLTSTEMPALRLKFDDAFKYIGGQDFILYDVARAEQHFFVDTDKQGKIRRLYWVQFEGYLPDNSHTYRYKADKSVKIGGLDFIADAAPRNTKGGLGRPDSDANRGRAFLEAKGYRMAGDDILTQRLVHLVDEAKRNELMIIYMEDLSGMGLTAADLYPNGRAASRWEEISKGLLERALKGIEILPL